MLLLLVLDSIIERLEILVRFLHGHVNGQDSMSPPAVEGNLHAKLLEHFLNGAAFFWEGEHDEPLLATLQDDQHFGTFARFRLE